MTTKLRQADVTVNQEELHQLLKSGPTAWNAWRKSHPGVALNLDGFSLKNLNLDGIDFSAVSFRDATVTGCSLRRASLISANFTGSNLTRNDLSGAKLIAAVLRGADLSESILNNASILTASTKGARLDRIDFRGHDLSGLDLRTCSLVGCNLSHQALSKVDLSNIDFTDANLENADLTYSNLTGAKLQHAYLKNTKLQGAVFKDANLDDVDLSGANLQGLDFNSASMCRCDLREANLQNTHLVDANITGAKLWRIQSHGWDIARIKCEHAYWDKNGKEKTVYRRYEFERIYREAITIELKYPHRLTNNELATLPILLEHLQASQWGTILRLKSITDVAGGALVSIIVEETGKHNPSEVKQELEDEANRIQLAQLAMRNNPDLQHDLKEAIAAVKDHFWPRFLELAAEHEREQIRNLTVVFMDLKGFTTWKGSEMSEKLALFRGLLKPVLNKWQAGFPNMEGDSLRVTFRNATAGLSCACMMSRVLFGAGFEVRVGVELGEVTVVHNEVTDISDLEGTAVSMAARLESVAEPGEVLATAKVRHYTDYKGIFKFLPRNVQLNKSIGNKKAGDAVECYAVELIKTDL